MCDEFPHWDITRIINTDERACLYLKAAAQFDTGNGDTIRLAWRDVQQAYDAGRISINMAMSVEELSQTFVNHGIEAVLILRITRALFFMGLQVMALPMAA